MSKMRDLIKDYIQLYDTKNIRVNNMLYIKMHLSKYYKYATQ